MELFVGKKIESLREGDGMSQGELAKVLGVTRQTISKWEADVCCPKANVLQALCGLFDVDMSYFTGVEVSPQQIGTLGEFIRKLRRRAKLSQEQFAERMGVSRRMASRWEADEVKPRAGMLQKLGECFCMDEEERQQLQRLAAEERAQSPAAEEGADGRALADAAEDNCGQNAAEDRLAEQFAESCAAAAAPPAPTLEEFTGDAQLFAMQGAAPIAEWAVSPAEGEACAAPKAQRKPWAAVAALVFAIAFIVFMLVVLIWASICPQYGDQTVQEIAWNFSAKNIMLIAIVIGLILLATCIGVLVHVLRNKQNADRRRKVGKKFTDSGN